MNAAPARSVWIITDGKIGDEVQCLAIAGALASSFEKKIIAPRPPWSWMAPWGPVDPRDAPSRMGSLLGPPFPDVLITSGRRAVPYAVAVKRASGGRVYTVMLKDPRIDPAKFDLVWAPSHDRIEGANVFKTLTSPHGLTAKFENARKHPDPRIAGLPKPMLGVVVGGPSGGAVFDGTAANGFSAKIEMARQEYASLAITPSRRTPPEFMKMISNELTSGHIFIWDGVGDNPYADILANADTLIVTADSHNMMSEAVSTGAGVYAFRPPGLAKKLDRFVSALETRGAVRRLDGAASLFSQQPVNATNEIVDAIVSRLST